MKFSRRPKSVVFKIVFSRTMITILLILIQLSLLYAMIFNLGEYSTYAMLALNIAATVCLIYLVNKDDIAEFKLAWAIPICALPVFGVVLFWLVDQNFGSRELKRKIRKRQEESAACVCTDDVTKAELDNIPARDRAFFEYMDNVGKQPTYAGGNATYFSWGIDKWIDLLSELENAKEFIFMEYFIIEKGEMWDPILNVLRRKAAEGVEVRVMYDGMCSILHLPYKYPKLLRRYGIKAQVFAPIVPLLSTHQNNRDHRKIVVIDGKVAYNGGVNLADEYINKKERFGVWKDTAVKIEGSAVDSFTLMFLQMWNAGKWSKQNDYNKYLHRYSQNAEEDVQTNGFIIPYADGPHQKENLAEKVYMDVLSTAEKYVHIMTPYFIIDNEMLGALKYAAGRGVDVKIILPHIPDKKIAFAIARTYYPVLLKYGVKFYEYIPGFLHAKVFTSDDKKAIVGSINLDYRSLYHHFECATYMYDNPVIEDVEKDFQDTLKYCQPIDLEYYKKISAGYRLVGWVFKLFAPLM